MIGLLGFDHNWASVELRGRLNFADDALLAALRDLGTEAAIAEVAILSTCNRTEIYVATSDWAAARTRILRFLERAYMGTATSITGGVGARSARQDDDPMEGTHPVRPSGERSGLPRELLAALTVREELDAVRHLFRVAAGLESMVVGEAQILGQVRQALQAAETVGVAGEELRAIFSAASKAGKRVRAQTAIGRVDASIAALAVRVAGESLGGLRGKVALVIGAGRTSQLCTRLLRAEDVGRIVLANRSPASAAALAREVGGEAIPLARIADALGDVQLILSATAAPHVVLTAATVAKGLGNRRAPLVIIDLAVPPDVDEATGLLPAVSLYSLDTLRSMEGRGDAPGGDAPGGDGDERRAEIAHAERILRDSLREYLHSQTVRLAVPGIAALRRHVDRSEQAELARVLAHLEHLSAPDREAVARFGQRLVDKMFHHLVSRIRSLAEFDEIPPELTMRVLAQLFADPGAPEAPDAPTPRGDEADPG